MKGADDLTPRQQEILNLIADLSGEKGIPPTLREMARAMGVRSVNSVRGHLDALKSKGYLEIARGRARGISLTRKARLRLASRAGTHVATGIPILGRISAGTPLFSEENLEGFLPLSPETVSGSREIFGLRVAGESMTGDGIFDGDVALVRKTSEANEGDMVVALVDGEATVKRIHFDRERIVLKPSNPTYPPVIVRPTSHRIVVVGVVEGVYRRIG